MTVGDDDDEVGGLNGNKRRKRKRKRRRSYWMSWFQGDDRRLLFFSYTESAWPSVHPPALHLSQTHSPHSLRSFVDRRRRGQKSLVMSKSKPPRRWKNERIESMTRTRALYKKRRRRRRSCCCCSFISFCSILFTTDWEKEKEKEKRIITRVVRYKVFCGGCVSSVCCVV